ncbi:hypothetical protein AGMMS49940_21380 [Spirochaetia bacterium]|nr:hypothetical protein AGMMS49940_21380 [Spirochaetia bacterium]
MTKKNAVYSICLLFVFMAFSGCEGMATLFHGVKPEDPYNNNNNPGGNGGIETPAAPSLPTVFAADSIITVSWAAVAGATAYEVWVETSNNSAAATKCGGDITAGLSAVISSLNNGTTYYVWIKAKNSAGTSGFSPVASATPVAASTVPQTPSVPSLAIGNAQIAVSWAAVEGATAYEVWAGTSNNSAAATKCGGDITAGLSTTINSLTNGTTYYVWVKAKNSVGTSGFSPIASGTPSASAAVPAAPPAAPTIVAGLSQLSVSWAAVDGATAYEVWAGTSNNSATATKRGGDITAGLSAVIGSLNNGTTYYVWVKAKNSMGTSGFSPVASGIPVLAAGLYKTTLSTTTKIGNQNLASSLDYISTYAISGDNYFIVLGANESASNISLSYSGFAVGITLMSNGAEQIVSLNADFTSLFIVNNGVSLILENNITLQGRSTYANSLVKVNTGGTLKMYDGAKICGNNVYSNSPYGGGGGVYVSGGTFTMSGGEISGNTATASTSQNSSYGGGVYISGGTFTMSGGKISENTASSSSSSASYSYGGGVYVNGGTFTMSGGEIGGNTASSSSSSTSYSYGGGVYIGSGTFTKSTGCIIYGSNVSATLKNTASSGFYWDGHAVYISTGSRKRNTTAGVGVPMNSSIGGATGGWE